MRHTRRDLVSPHIPKLALLATSFEEIPCQARNDENGLCINLMRHTGRNPVSPRNPKLAPFAKSFEKIPYQTRNDESPTRQSSTVMGG